jgi:hypothetical protein
MEEKTLEEKFLFDRWPQFSCDFYEDEKCDHTPHEYTDCLQEIWDVLWPDDGHGYILK